MKPLIIAVLTVFVLCSANGGCSERPDTTDGGITKASVRFQPGPDGLSVEQRNVSERLLEDNRPGAIKHLYVISAYSGQVLIYSTVRGKVTSGGKRLSPSNEIGWDDGSNSHVLENIADDGTYGSSMQYLYWWDSKGIYHQHYVEGGQILHISSEPLAVKSITINMEAVE